MIKLGVCVQRLGWVLNSVFWLLRLHLEFLQPHLRRQGRRVKMNENRLSTAERVVQECFWGDYRISAQEILDRLDKGDIDFERFLFSKIMDNSSYPSLHLRTLFAQETLQVLLGRYLKQAGHTKRVRLVAANLTGQYDLVPEEQWTR